MPPKPKKGKPAPKPPPAAKAAKAAPKAAPKPAKAGKAAKPKKAKKEKPKKTKNELRIPSYDPVKMKCPLCKKSMTTRVVYKPLRPLFVQTIVVYLATCFPCKFGVRVLGLFRDANHYCTKCGKLLAKNSW